MQPFDSDDIDFSDPVEAVHYEHHVESHYPNFTAAVSALYANGISDAVTFNVYGGDYNEQVNLFGPIPGASIDDTVKFFDASGTARLRVTTHLASDRGVIHDSLASFVIFDGIDIYLDQVNDSTYKCLVMKGASNCIFRNADWRGAGYSASTVKYGVYMWSTASNNNVFENIHFHRHNTAFRASGSTTQRHTGNIIRNCTIDDVWYAAYVTYTPNFQFYGNDVQINGPGGSSVYGIDAYTQASGDAVFVYRNNFHNLTTAGSSSYIHGYVGTGAVLNVYNNFFYDIQTTGSATPYVALYANTSGTTNFDFNSVRLNDVASTGQIRVIYKASTSAIVNIRNNIFYSEESTAATDIIAGITAGTYAPNILDYNAYYNGGGVNCQIYDVGSDEYATLAELQNATAFEDHGVEGNPGFTSATDLHILPTQGLVSNNGLALGWVTDDIDALPRQAPPDIGADEYVYLAPSDDYAVLEILDVQTLYPELTLFSMGVRVQNRGSAAQTDIPIRLFYNGAQQGSDILLSLAIDEVDTVYFPWTTPAAPDAGILAAQSFLPGDADPTNDRVEYNVTIVGQPMHGAYDIGGGGNHYNNFSSAVLDMTLRTIDGAVTFNVYPLTYNESIDIPAITGASSTNTITFQAAGALLTPPELVGAGPVVRLDGADYLTFDGIDIIANTSARVVLMVNGCDYNTFRNLDVTGNDVSNTSTYGIDISGGGNDYNVVDNVTVSGCNYGVRFYGASGTQDVGNVCRNSTIVGGKYSTYLYYQEGGAIHDCDIQPGWNGANTEIYGVYCGTIAAGDTCWAWGNEVHNIQSQSTCNGIYGNGSSGLFIAHNNFVYGWMGPTGTSVMYGLRAPGGVTEWYFNSVYIGDIATTGNIYAFYMTGTSTVATVKNNIFQVDEPVEDCWGIYVASGTLTSNHNCFYSSGPGALYYVGRTGGLDYSTLATWQGTGQDANSVEGNPGFIGPTNLHITPTFSLVNGVGVTVTGITADIDGDLRGSPPDIGADEYVFSSMPHDYGVNGFIGLQPTYVTNTPVIIQAEVKNYGTSPETNVPVRLYYNNVQQDEVLLSLASGAQDTVDLDWTPPVTGFEIGELKVKAFCPSDGFALNDSVATSVTIVGPPMSGTYNLGGGVPMDFANFAEAVSALLLRGIDGEVIIDCYEGTYVENVEIGPIPGASFADRVIFQAHEGALDDIVTLTASGGTEVLYINGADYVTFDGIDVVATGSVNVSVLIDNDADYVTLRNMVVTGRDSTSTSIRGVKLTFNGNDNCVCDNLTVTGAFYGLRNESGSGGSDNWEIMNCTVSGASYCVYLDDASGRVHDNDFQPHGYASTSAYGVYISFLTADDTVHVYNNRFHNFRHTSTTDFATVAGVYSTCGTTSYAYVYNNFFYDWQTNGPDIFGIRTTTGNTFVYNNSIRMNDVANAGDYAGIYVSSGSVLSFVNNVIQVDEATNTCYGIWRAAGTLVSDNNCFYGTGAAFFTGRDVSTDYPTLPNWQVLGYDLSSVAGDPGFLSASDLHIDPVFTLLNAAGAPLTEVTDDIDGDLRGTPPDIGADEYVALVQPDPVTALTVAADVPNSDVILRWVASPNANSYKVYAGDTPDFVIDVGSQVGHTGNLIFVHNDILLTGTLKFYVVLASTDAPPAR
ncbi:hypothetical protein KJ815_07765 [bacterium]|nr:hypothetical protein [bacterium]